MLEKGTRIYYGGDMVNPEGTGTIIGIEQSKWGDNLSIDMDDGREINVMPTAFSEAYEGHGGTNFVTLAAYNEYRRQGLIRLGCKPEDIKDVETIS